MDGRPCGPTLLPPVAVAVAVPSAIPSHRFALPRAGSPATCLSSFCPLDSAPRFKTRRGLAFRDNVVIRVGFRGRLAAAFCLFFFLHAENCARNRFRPRARASDPSSSVMCAQFTCSRDYSRVGICLVVRRPMEQDLVRLSWHTIICVVLFALPRP
jgi:hypothetical protein